MRAQSLVVSSSTDDVGDDSSNGLGSAINSNCMPETS